MKTHFIYNSKTGDIVHIHFSDEGQDTSKEGVLHKLHSSVNKSELDVHTLDGLAEPASYKFDVGKKQLIKGESKEDSPGGSAGVQKPDDPAPSKNVKTTYKKS